MHIRYNLMSVQLSKVWFLVDIPSSVPIAAPARVPPAAGGGTTAGPPPAVCGRTLSPPVRPGLVPNPPEIPPIFS